MNEILLRSLSLDDKKAVKKVMAKQHRLQVRPATPADRQQLAYLIHFETFVHRHLDWRPPLDWLGRQPYWVAEDDGKIVAALACPPDPAHIAWMRLFGVGAGLSPDQAWQALWPVAKKQLIEMQDILLIAAIPLQNWFQNLLAVSDFELAYKVVMLSWDRRSLPRPLSLPDEYIIRPMTLDDLPAVEAVDAAAFSPEWQNSQDCLELAFRQAAVATVCELEGRVVAYQISTPTPVGGHLARLAVHPDAQRKGLGSSLVHDMLSQFVRRGAQRVTVNTQQINSTSLALYRKAGFRLTGEEYPVFEYRLK